jgi:hypothetical protein
MVDAINLRAPFFAISNVGARDYTRALLQNLGLADAADSQHLSAKLQRAISVQPGADGRSGAA